MRRIKVDTTKTLRGTKLAYNAAQQARYVLALKKLVRKMTDETNKQVVNLFYDSASKDYFKQQKKATAMDDSISSQARILMNKLTATFTSLFAMKAKPLAESMVKGATAASKASLHSSLQVLSGGLSLKTGVVPAGMEDVSTATVAENVSLIKSIPAQYFKDITGSVMRSITTGNGLADLMPDLRKYSTQTDARVRNLALDQTRKAYNNINKQRMVAIGVKQFEWLHSGGGQKPRTSHLKIAGHIFNFATLEDEQAALGVPEADRGIPGHPINCRCTMRPIVDFST